MTVKAFDTWIRTRFVELNSELEALYFAQPQRDVIGEVGGNVKEALVSEGREQIIPLLEEGNTDQGFDSAFELLGNVGMYMAACRRHEITVPDRETRSPLVEASALAMHLGASLGVTPRFATSHLETHNRAVDGVFKTFTDLDAEHIFLEYNTRALFAYREAADALVRILPLGVSHPLVTDFLKTAEQGLANVLQLSSTLYEKLDVDRFFYCVRPYFKPFRVGTQIYRGANAGDFAGINEIDMLLGLCRANNSTYSQLLVDKFLYMIPDDQARLRDCMRRRSLLDQFLDVHDSAQDSNWFNSHVRAFLDVCAAHGAAAAQHHDQLVTQFIERPSVALSDESLKHVTASGPPLPVLMNSLEKLRDLRLAVNREDIPSRYADLQQLREAIAGGPA